MPSLWHDSGIELCRDDPDVITRLLRQAGVSLAADTRLLLAPASETDRMLSKDLEPDTVLAVGSVEKPTRVIIVELQQAASHGKLRQWPRYAASKWLRYECPVDLLVICPDEDTAAWYDGPIPTALDGYTHRPIILRPVQVPAMASAQLANSDPAMGVMSMTYHGANQEPAEDWKAAVNWEVVTAFAEGILSLEPAKAKKYYEIGFGMAPEVVRYALEHLMETKYREPFSKLGQRYYGEGREEGLVAGERGTVLMVLKARGLAVSDRQREAIDACNDLATLKGWAEAALVAATTDDVLR